jgi:hypothetical protein
MDREAGVRDKRHCRRDPRLPRDGPQGRHHRPPREPQPPRRDPPQDVQRHAHAEHHGQDLVRVAASRPHLLLHDQLRRGGHAHRQRRRAHHRRRGLRAIPRSRGARVAGLHPPTIRRPVLRQHRRSGQGAADAGPLRQPRTQLHHDLESAGDADAASRGGGVRAQRNGQSGDLLLRRRSGVGRGRARRFQFRRHAGMSGDHVLPKQRIRDLHTHQGPVQGGRHRGQGAGVRRPHAASGRQRRARGLQRHQNGQRLLHRAPEAGGGGSDGVQVSQTHQICVQQKLHGAILGWAITPLLTTAPRTGARTRWTSGRRQIIPLQN